MKSTKQGEDHEHDKEIAKQWWQNVRNLSNIDSKIGNSNDIMNMRNEKLKDCNTTVEEILSVIQQNDKLTLHNLLEKLWLEPIWEEDVIKVMKMDNERINRLLKYRQQHLGRRFIACYKAVMH